MVLTLDCVARDTHIFEVHLWYEKIFPQRDYFPAFLQNGPDLTNEIRK